MIYGYNLNDYIDFIKNHCSRVMAVVDRVITVTCEDVTFWWRFNMENLDFG
jgi:hypothetical protein